MNIIFKYFTVLFFLLMIGLIIKNFLSKKQQKTVHELVSLMAKILLLVAFLSLLWRMW
ncbi:hypothetical protein QG083_03210 [Kingella kingae]|uniref:Uncharacterized protein n=1 Tax=Kingella kingae ATCC 23330 TaxID=887327 RepID=F5S4G9_KINKI|nr:hypothetical protein [Kingella kingae]EGK12103.1 hypothetical protein HMPREF0476_0102 [Kingella kingae ATCC 23330]MBD3613331.1 hypothetical protein [Kingella kingae]MBD3631690.1 hypothetical protein [Kingella kingae]MBD3659138.1 hypothetical protein [Kingella kingae]MDK4526132.1 hypothetical protein [Kingella kingae]